MMRVAVVVGHSKANQGAINTDGVQEWTWNRVLALQLEQLLTDAGYTSRIFYRTRGVRRVAAATNNWRADLVLSLHFNSIGRPGPSGCVALHWPSSSAGRAWAIRLGEAARQAIGNKRHGDHGTCARGQARAWNRNRTLLYILHDTKAPTVILEPFFGSNPEDTRKATFARDSGALARALVKAIEAGP